MEQTHFGAINKSPVYANVANILSVRAEGGSTHKYSKLISSSGGSLAVDVDVDTGDICLYEIVLV